MMSNVAVQEHWQRARATWPSLDVSLERFTAYVAERVAPLQDDPMAAMATSDLYLCAACLDGNVRALAEFERSAFAPAASILAARGETAAMIDEVRQQLFARLFLPGAAGEPPKIASYGGRGPLRAWVQMAAIRVAHNLRRALPRETAVDAVPAPVSPAPDPELAYLQEHYRAEFRAAVAVAMAELAPDQRAVLLHYFVDGLTLHQIGGLYDVDPSTISRWLLRARKVVLARTRTWLAQRLGVPDTQVDSVLRLLGSQLEASVERLLERAAP
jgi:RNA polymerase sigma-70 factor (ECF subfamily)